LVDDDDEVDEPRILISDVNHFFEVTKNDESVKTLRGNSERKLLDLKKVTKISSTIKVRQAETATIETI